MASIKELIQSIESGDSSFDEKLAAINQMEETLIAMRNNEEQAVNDNVELIVEAIKVMEKKVNDQLEIAKSIVPEKGDKGDRGLDGAPGRDGVNGRDGRDGKDGQNGQDGADGVSVTDAKIDFDGSLIITLSTGREINVGEVVASDLAEKIKVISTMSTNTAIADITGGTINNTVIGGTTPAAGTFTTLTATGQTSLGGAAGSEGLRVVPVASSTRYLTAQGSTADEVYLTASGPSGSNVALALSSRATGAIRFYTNTANQEQMRVSHTASAVNYVQVTGGATTIRPTISAQGSDVNLGLSFTTKGTGRYAFFNNSAQSSSQFSIGLSGLTTAVNYLNVNGAAAGSAPAMTAEGNDTNIDLNLTPKGTGGVVLGNNQANYADISGGATTKAVEFNTLGSDTNVAVALRSKGTGAIDLAAGSSGVNISNGGTVTAITTTASGASYTSAPTATISAPTTAGGVQATAQPYVQSTGAFTIANGGTGYTVGDVLTFSGGTGVFNATASVASVSAGVITGLTFSSGGAYTVVPTNPISVTGGTGTGATFNFTQYILRTSAPSWLITNAGSGYVEQPTVSFSGGGGSGAAAYATVGSGSIIRSLGLTGTQSLSFYVPSGEVLRIRDTGSVGAYHMVNNTASGTTLVTQGTANAFTALVSNGTSPVQFGTNGNTGNTQMQVSHTASAVNYVQVTGAATGSSVVVSSQGSDTNIGMIYNFKGTASHSFNGNNGTHFQVTSVASGANFLRATGAAASSAPVLSAQGSDTNIDLTLTPKGTGNVRFGTYTGTILTPTGYVEIKDSGGTVRRLLVG
jgi:hypothetical protein